MSLCVLHNRHKTLSLSHTPILNTYICVCITVSNQSCMDRKLNRKCECLIWSIKSTDFQSNTLFLSRNTYLQSSKCRDMNFIDCMNQIWTKIILNFGSSQEVKNFKSSIPACSYEIYIADCSESIHDHEKIINLHILVNIHEVYFNLSINYRCAASYIYIEST